MAVIRELITRLGFTIDDAEARRYNRMVSNLGKKLRSVGRTMSLFVTAPIVAMGGAFIKVAADAEETESKFREVFRGINDEADAMAKGLSKDFDVANVTAQEMLSTTGSLLVQFGFTTEAALEMSNQVAALSVDIASFENVQGGAERASLAITKALLGEREMLKGINKVVLEEDVTKKIAILRAQGMTFETNRQAKAIATLTLVTEQSERAIGDYSRTQESATNRTRKLRQQFIDLSVKLGKVLLPLYTDLVEVLTDVVEWLNSLSPAGRKTIIIIAGIAAALGPLLIVLGSIIGALTAIVGLVGIIPILVIAAVAAIAALGFLIMDDIKAFTEGRKSVFGLIFDGAKTIIDRILNYLSETWLGDIAEFLDPLFTKSKELMDNVLEYLAGIWDDWIKAHVQPWIDRVAALAESVGIGVPEAERTPAARAVREAASAAFFTSSVGAPFKLLRDAFSLGQASPQLASAGAITNSNVTVNMEVTAAPGESAEATGQAAIRELNRTLGEAASKGAITPRIAP